MNNEEHDNDLLERLEAADSLPGEPMPAGWSRRNWVQRDAIAFAAAARALVRRDPAAE
jgi:hypothetical protein